MASTGLVAMTMTQSGDAPATSLVTWRMISALACSRSSRLIPGFLANPDVMTTRSDPAVSP